MKRIIVAIWLICQAFTGNAQAFLLRTNGTYTPGDPRLNVPWNLYIPRVNDTTNALNGGKDTLGAIVYDWHNNKVWVRDTIPGGHRWLELITSVHDIHPVNWCNVKNAGADSTGNTDASPYVQALINAGCKVIYFPAGTWWLKKTIQLKDSVMVIGDGRSTVIKLTQNTPGLHCSFSSGGQWSAFTNLTIAGNKDSTLQDGIRTDSCKGILFSNVYFFKIGGYGVHFYKAKSSTEGSNVISCYADSCRGAFFADFSEFNKISSTIVTYCDTGIYINAGNNTVNDCNITKGTIGIYLVGHSSGGEFNDAHTGIAGNIIAHNFRAGLYATGVTNGEQFSHNIIRNNSVYDVYAETSDNLWFDDCDLGVDSLVFVNCTNTNLTDNKYWNATTGRPGPPSQFLRWRVVGTAPTITGVGYAGNTFSLYDGATNSTFNMAHNNNVVDLSTSSAGRIRLNDSVVVGTNLFGSEASGGILKLYSTSNATKGMIYLGDSSVYDPINKRIGINIINPSYPIHLYRTSGTNAIQMTNNGPTSLSFLRFTNDASNVAQFIFGGSGAAPFVPNGGLEIDGQNYFGIVSENGQISFGKSTTLNGSGEHGRFFNNGHFVLNTITDNGHQFQVNGGVTINKDSVPILSSITSQYVAVLDTTNSQVKRISVANLNPYTASNGITLSGNNFKWGGSLIENTTISNSSGSNNITFTGVNGLFDNPFMTVDVTSGGGNAFKASTTDGIAIDGETTDGYGLYGHATTGSGEAIHALGNGSANGINTICENGIPLAVTADPTTGTNNVIPLATFYRTTQGGTPAQNFGGSLDLRLQTNLSNQLAGQLIWKWSGLGGSTDGTRKSQIEVWNVNNAVTQQVLTLTPGGQLRLNKYGVGTFSGGVAYPTAVDGSGNLSEVPPNQFMSYIQIRYAQVASVTVSGTTSETTLLNTGSSTGTLQLPANYLTVGKTYRISIRGKYSTDATNPATMDWKFKLGSTVICSTGATVLGTNKTDKNYEIHADFTVRTTGVTGTLMGQGMFLSADGPLAQGMTNSFSTVTINTTAINTVNLTVTLSDSSAGNSTTVVVAYLEEVNP